MKKGGDRGFDSFIKAILNDKSKPQPPMQSNLEHKKSQKNMGDADLVQMLQSEEALNDAPAKAKNPILHIERVKLLKPKNDKVEQPKINALVAEDTGKAALQKKKVLDTKEGFITAKNERKRK